MSSSMTSSRVMMPFRSGYRTTQHWTCHNTTDLHSWLPLKVQSSVHTPGLGDLQGGNTKHSHPLSSIQNSKNAEKSLAKGSKMKGEQLYTLNVLTIQTRQRVWKRERTYSFPFEKCSTCRRGVWLWDRKGEEFGHLGAYWLEWYHQDPNQATA